MNLFLNPHLIEGCVWLELVLASEGAARCTATGKSVSVGAQRPRPVRCRFRVKKRAVPSPVQPMEPA
jgi:hypothetical protein